MIRAAAPSDLPLLQDIERAAGAPFAAIGMTSVAEDDPPSIATLREFADAGRAWVWTDSRRARRLPDPGGRGRQRPHRAGLGATRVRGNCGGSGGA